MTILANMSPAQAAEFNAALLASGGDGVARGKSGNRAALIGNSKAQSLGYTGIVGRQCDTSFFTWMNAELGGAFELVASAGIGGQSSYQILARFASDALSQNPDWVFIVAADNDLHSGTYNQDETVANHASMIDQAKAKGARCVILTASPTTKLNSFWTATRASNCLKLNDALRRMVGDKQGAGAIIVDAFKAEIDPLAVDVQPKAYMLQTVSGGSIGGIHENPKGARQVGIAAANAVRPFIGAIDFLPSSRDDRYAYNTNGATGELNNDPLFVLGGTTSTSNNQTAGTIVGQVPLSHNLTKTGTWGAGLGTCDIVARADGFGNDWSVSVTNTGADGDALLLVGPNLISRVTPGTTRIQVAAGFSVSGLTNFRGVGVYADVFAPSGVVRSSIFERAPGSVDPVPTDGVNGWSQDAWNYGTRGGVVTIPADATSLKFSMYMLFGAGGAGTIKVGRGSIRSVVDPRV